ncbi:MAG: class I SAM-dependent methyltransferase [Planctomycetes bacterium]|nr:class I SAM-dependent methyltransferase [Planctomycetota bacterium]
MAVDTLYDLQAIRQMFDEMAETYGVVNSLSSFGFAARWRQQVVAALPLLDPPQRLADLMSGCGEIWTSVAKRLPTVTEVIAVEISPEMSRRASRKFRFTVEVLQADVLEPQLPPESCDAVVSSFGLKTLSREQQDCLAQRVAELLRPGGSFSFVEISVPPNRWLRMLYLLYLSRGIPLIGRVCLGNPSHYRRLGEYTRAFGDSQYFAQALNRAGLHAEFVSYFYGCATGVRGRKPAP